MSGKKTKQVNAPELFPDVQETPVKRCKTCVFRKWIQYAGHKNQFCELKRSKKSRSGLAFVNASDIACSSHKTK